MFTERNAPIRINKLFSHTCKHCITRAGTLCRTWYQQRQRKRGAVVLRFVISYIPADVGYGRRSANIGNRTSTVADYVHHSVLENHTAKKKGFRASLSLRGQLDARRSANQTWDRSLFFFPPSFLVVAATDASVDGVAWLSAYAWGRDLGHTHRTRSLGRPPVPTAMEDGVLREELLDGGVVGRQHWPRRAWGWWKSRAKSSSSTKSVRTCTHCGHFNTVWKWSSPKM